MLNKFPNSFTIVFYPTLSLVTKVSQILLTYQAQIQWESTSIMVYIPDAISFVWSKLLFGYLKKGKDYYIIKSAEIN